MGENKVEKKKKGGLIKKVLIVVLVLLCVSSGAFAGYMFFQSNKGSTKSTSAVTQQQTAQSSQNKQSNSAQQIVSSKTYSLDEFLVNLSDEGGQRYLKTTVYVGYESKKLDSELADKKPMLRDAVISVLRTKKAADFSAKGIEDIKSELISRLNPMLSKGQLTTVYFYDILVQ